MGRGIGGRLGRALRPLVVDSRIDERRAPTRPVLAMQSLLRPFAFGLLGVLFILPLAIGLLGSGVAAFGFYPGSPEAGFTQALSDPRLVTAISSTLFTGLVGTAFAMGLALLALMLGWGKRWFSAITGLLPPMLAVPHAALAVGLVFVLAPSGWLVRMVLDSRRPPDEWIVPDAYGLSLILGLGLKEFPFLLFTALALTPRIRPDLWIKQGLVLGYTRWQCWTRLVLPQLLPQMRLPIAVVLTYNLTVVDMALLLGPGQPPTLAALVLEWFNQPAGRSVAAAGAMVLLVVMAVGFLMSWGFAQALSVWLRRRRTNGVRAHTHPAIARLGGGLLGLIGLLSVLALVCLPLWSFAQRWRFPDALPSTWTLRFWSGRWNQLGELLEHTLILAGASTLLALIAAVAWLELERLRRVPKIDAIWYVPLLLPQVCVMLGWQGFALFAHADGKAATVIWAHWVYVLPYVILMLAGGWRDLSVDFDKQAQVLGYGYGSRLWRVRLPLMMRPLLSAAAVGVAVSVAQYLPTLLLSGGRIPTLTTELVTSFGGVDRRMIGALATLQLLLPLLAFALAIWWPRFWFRHRKSA